ncbi:MAG: SGNH/GDSL hydrolase family protein [Deltaproteobacteria bacterium]|nr:SGNH/GDSL hydrolase family protein [Deltaproteobacteria bacterium]MBI3293847.1 SGNH/GDSL hydrolase family protein [Deltaproteobacteria bacterium]
MPLEKLRKRYLDLSLWVTNTAVVFLILNLGLAAVFAVRELQYRSRERASRAEILTPRPGQPPLTDHRTDYAMKWVDLRSFEGVDPIRVEVTLDNFFDLEKAGYRYSPYVAYSNVPFKSPSVNITADSSGYDFRPSGSPPNPKKVFLLGGSTTFGTHVADEWTYPSYLAPHLKAEVINFGRPNYSWYQEMVLLQRLLHSGYRPKAVVFMDGVNVFSPDGTPMWSDKMQTLWEETQVMPRKNVWPDFIPLFRLVNFINSKRREATFKRRLQDRIPASTASFTFPESYKNTLDQVRALGKQFGFKPLFVLQPNRAVNCEPSDASRAVASEYATTIQTFYKNMANYRAPDYVDLSGLCRGAQHAFVDDVHYSPQFNERLASRLAESLRPLLN